MNKNYLIKMAGELYKEAFDANASFTIMEQYDKQRKNYNKEINISPAFYTIVYQSIQKACFMDIAKLYDKTPKAVTIGELLQLCENNKEFFPEYKDIIKSVNDGKEYVTSVPYRHVLKPTEECFFKKEVEQQRNLCSILSLETATVTVELTFSEFLQLYQKRYYALNKKRTVLYNQRNTIYAHNDKKAIYDIDSIFEKNPIFYSDIKELIDFALDVTRFIIAALTGVCKAEQYSNIDDWESTLKLVQLGLKRLDNERKTLKIISS